MGVVDILVNNAGIIKRIPMCEMTAAQFRQVDVDLNAPFIVSKAVIPGMIEGTRKDHQHLQHDERAGARDGERVCGCKGGLKMLTKNIASEYGEYNIQCNGIGPIHRDAADGAAAAGAPGGRKPPPTFDQFIIAKTPAARWGTTEDLVGPAVFLASDASNFVNGHVLYVDGGILAYIGKQPQ